MSEIDAERLGIAEGDLVRVTSRRGVAEAPARIGEIHPAELFLPFHYGYWDEPGRPRAANELTLYGWDPVSKQPYFKYALAAIIPHWAPPTHALEIFHHAEKGSIQMLWISATNPAVSLPNLSKVRTSSPAGIYSWLSRTPS